MDRGLSSSDQEVQSAQWSSRRGRAALALSRSGSAGMSGWLKGTPGETCQHQGWSCRISTGFALFFELGDETCVPGRITLNLHQSV